MTVFLKQGKVLGASYVWFLKQRSWISRFPGLSRNIQFAIATKMFSVVLYFISVSNKLKTIPKHQIETMSLPEIPATVKSIHLKQAFIKRTSGNCPESLPTPPRLRRSVLIGEKRIQETQGSEKQVKSERDRGHSRSRGPLLLGVSP